MSTYILNPFTGQLDATGSGGGGGGSVVKYSATFLIAAWTLNSGMYEYSVPQSTHAAGTSPNVQVFQLVTSNYEFVQPAVIVNASGDITLQVTSSPDLRFDGKIIVL